MDLQAPGRLVRALGERGEGDGDGNGAWLGRLTELVKETAARAHLDVERVVVPGGRSGLVLLVRLADGTPAALKLAPPSAAPERERAALELWDGFGAVRVLGEVAGGLLLERLRPEVSLRSLPEAKALLEAAGTVRRLWVPPPPGHGFESVADRTEVRARLLRDVAGDEPLAMAALSARDALVGSAPGDDHFVLHGRFRQGKVLAGERAPWLTVGPEPLVGERAYDLSRLARDRAEDLVAAASGASATRRRVNKLADSLDLDAERLRGWTLFGAVESAVRAVRAGRRQQGEGLLEFASWL
ncbi:aminoglycoside phosphotransferase family protein [Streptomyces sp. NPDC047315]|uniref:aminoglycoside phosphotransferase family protein n=1 Tax=Streptomyces sp. NPDC047315 TaxID=3155142 RepID=UPI0033F24CD1